MIVLFIASNFISLDSTEKDQLTENLTETREALYLRILTQLIWNYENNLLNEWKIA